MPPPARAAAAFCATKEGTAATICAIPSTCPAIARTSQSGQSVGRAQSSGPSVRSSASKRPYSVAASCIAVARSRTAAREEGRAIVLALIGVPFRAQSDMRFRCPP